MGYVRSNLGRKTIEVTTAAFAFREVVVLLQVGGDRDKGAIVTSEVLTGHVRARLGALLEDVEIMERVTPRIFEMGIESADLLAERGEGGVGVGKGVDCFPGLAFCTCVTTRPEHPIGVRGVGAATELIDGIKEDVKTQVIRVEVRRVFVKR
jgi:hypothetical protein